MCWFIPSSLTSMQMCAPWGRAGLPRNCVAIWYLLLNYSNGQIKRRVWAWSENKTRSEGRVVAEHEGGGGG